MHESTRNQDERNSSNEFGPRLGDAEMARDISGPAALTWTHFQEILAEAEARTHIGKGAERHSGWGGAMSEDLSTHDWWGLLARSGSGGPQFQIEKKLSEYRRTFDRNQLLDIINYAAAMICKHDSIGGHPW